MCSYYQWTIVLYIHRVLIGIFPGTRVIACANLNNFPVTLAICGSVIRLLCGPLGLYLL